MPPAARPLVRLVFLELVAFGIVLPMLPGTATRLGSGAVLAGIVVATDSLMQFFFAPWWGRLSDRAGRRPVLLLGLAGSVAAYLLFGLAGSIGVLLLSRVVAGATGSTFHVAQAYVADVTEPSRGPVSNRQPTPASPQFPKSSRRPQLKELAAAMNPPSGGRLG